MAKMIRANTNAVLTIEALDSARVTVNENHTYDVDQHEWMCVLREHPWVFDVDVEEASAAPGEKRSTRRPAPKK